MLTMGGQILFILGGVIRGKFLRGSIAPPRSGQVINICVEKTVTKNCRWANPKMPPTPWRKRPTTREKWPPRGEKRLLK